MRKIADRGTTSITYGIALSILTFGLTSTPSLADDWSSAFTPTQAHLQDVSGSLFIFVGSNQSILNPANCTDADQYGTNDSVITNQVLATALSALASGYQLEVDVSTSACADDRPEIVGLEIVE